MKKTNIPILLEQLHTLYPDATCELHYRNPFELLIAVVLSAQCTDKLVNQVTPALFEKYPTAHQMSSATQEELENAIRRIGLFRSKAKHILETSKILVEKFNGEIPNDHEELVKLPGVGRKTANVVQSVAFGVPAIAVDTHVNRLSHRLGISKASQVLQVEKDLMKKIPRDEWTFAHHSLILHGRRVCYARKPDCGSCTLQDICPGFKKEMSAAAKVGKGKTSVKKNPSQ